MRFFLKCFVIALASQLGLLGLILATGIGYVFIYFFYLMPYLVLALVFPMPDGIGVGPISSFFLISLPAVVYSALIALIITLVAKVVSPKREPLA